MRIVAGRWRGRTLTSPTWDGLRPTSDRLRETLFDILAPVIDGARVLDGYAGTGAVGIEALSRGAAHVTFVERDPRAVRLIETNLAALGPSGANDRAIIRADFMIVAARLGNRSFDLIIVDPPYAHDAAEQALTAAAPLAGPSTRLIVEHASRFAAPAAVDGLQVRRTVKAGDSALSFYER
ncbi:MAG TPA: 16S rRNA (guanine(966)-N(2))-methyltransferase RsmD [Vicinamibacterales bacterium]|jgi:16S rRNA (guanine(966)-N(2))-methyltransferase RsmD